MTDIPDEAFYVVAHLFRDEVGGNSGVELPKALEALAHRRSMEFARAALEAVVPALLAAERERIAQAILALVPAMEDIGSQEDVVYHDTLVEVARIARGEA